MYAVDVSPDGNMDSQSKTEAIQRSVYNMHALGESMQAGPIPRDTTKPSAPSSDPLEPVKKKVTKSAFSRAPRKSSSPSIDEDQSTATTTNDHKVKDGEQQENCSTSSPLNEAKDTERKSLEDQLDEILNAFLASKELTQGTSTKQHIAVSTNVLSEMDAITTRLVSAISNAQTVHTGGKLQVPVAGSTYAMDIPRLVALPELRRLRRQYLQWVSTHPPDDTSEKGIAESFLEYVEAQLK